MNRVLAVVCAFLLGITIFGVATGNDSRTVEQQARAVTLQMETNDGTCSLIVIAPGEALTAAHCRPKPVKGKDASPSRVEQNGQWLPITKWHVYKGTDLAKITVPGLACPCAIPLKGDALQDEPVILVGYPYGMAQVLTRGDVQSRVVYENENLLLITASAAGGNSGGGAFIVRGGQVYLLGITSRAAPEGHLVLITEVAPT